jgi:polyisoprenoid-binding protein YceI
MASPGRSIRLGPGDGTLLLRTRRTGFASRVGHDLTIALTAWSADVTVPDLTQPSGGRVNATMDLSTLEVREGSGGAVPLTDRDRREIEANARRMLEVDRYPMATFVADRFNGTTSEATVTGVLDLHGTQRPVTLHVRQELPNRVWARATVAQTAFGIKPYSAFMGALKLRDEVSVECDVDLDRVAGTDRI